MTLDAPSSNKSGCPESPEYQAIIDFVARNTYSPEKLGNLDELKNKHNCSITSKDDAAFKAVEALQNADPLIVGFPSTRPDSFFRAGVGVSASYQAGRISIEQVIPNGPADAAGLKSGDRIKSIDGTNIENRDNFIEAVSLLTAPPNGTSRGGLGIGLMREDGGTPRVNNIEKGSPADKMGLLNGDAIVAIDGISTSKSSLVETNKRLEGNEGSSVSLTIERSGMKVSVLGLRTKDPFPTAVMEVERDGKNFELSVGRKPVEIPTVSSKVGAGEIIPGGEKLPEDAAYLRVNNFFARNTVQQMWDVLKEPIDAQGKTVGNSKAIILDLRGNPGGRIDDVVLASSLFANQGTVYKLNSRIASDPSSPKYETQEVSLTPQGVVTTDGTATAAGAPPRIQSGEGMDLSKPKQLIVLINEHTAGAAEMLADSLKVNAGATVIGTQTRGLGIVSVAHQAGDKLMVNVPIGRIHTASGKWLGDARDTRIGVTPDITVHNDTWYGAKDDQQIKAAIQLINEKSGK